MSGPDPAAERPRNPRPTPKAQPDREGDLPTPDCCRKAALPAPTCKVQNEGAAPHTGAALFFMSGGSISVSAPAAERHHAAARTKVPPRPTSGPAPQPTSRARRSFPSRTLHPKAGGTRGIREAPQKTAGRGQTASGHGPLPRHSIRSGQKTGGSGKGRKQRRRRDGGEGGEGGREGEKGEGSQKAGKQKSWEAGSREAGKPGSGRRHKKA